MPIPSPARSDARRDPGLTRRTAVGAGLVGAAAVLTGCTPTSGIDRRPKPGATKTRAAAVDPDVALAATVLAHEEALLDHVLVTIERHPDLETVLVGARSSHLAHIDLLKDAVPDDVDVPATGSPTASSSVSPSVSPSAAATPPSPSRVPARAAVALGAIGRAEDRLALVGRRSSFAAESGAFARVLASMAAAAAQQATTLAAAARERR